MFFARKILIGLTSKTGPTSGRQSLSTRGISMKIMHCCLACFYIDGFGYQENILPRIHKEMGHDVEIVASTETMSESGTKKYLPAGISRDEHDIKIIRLPYAFGKFKKFGRKLRLYSGLKNVLDDFKPDLLFIHDSQFLSAFEISQYARKNGVRVLVDGHADFINSARGYISRKVLHGIIYKACTKSLDKVAERFFATLPLRAKFMEETYSISRNRISFLPFGIDDGKTAVYQGKDET
jgi:1,2-diacylglycerol 3-alpha-glucosyltransferase